MSNNPCDQLRKIVGQPEAPLSLARGALQIARLEYPDLPVEAYLDQLQILAETVNRRCAKTSGARARLQQLNHVLFHEFGLAPNSDNYYDTDNSYLNRVLDERTGIPISLSVIYIETGRLAGLDLEGVSFPGHFLVRANLDGQTAIIDAFAHGSQLDDATLAAELKHNPALRGLNAPGLARLLAPASIEEILTRMLRNLGAILLQAGALEKALTHTEASLAIDPGQPLEIRNRGLIFEKLECFNSALNDLTAYLQTAPAAEDAPAMQQKIIELQKKAAQLH
ncbi:MAG: tetratricopeptide repeat protein [Gammaproteobacteria bacterium]|nr:tetratricopeptide repeat protein [Gammaproteobacteria bacterium]